MISQTDTVYLQNDTIFLESLKDAEIKKLIDQGLSKYDITRFIAYNSDGSVTLDQEIFDDEFQERDIEFITHSYSLEVIYTITLLGNEAGDVLRRFYYFPFDEIVHFRFSEDISDGDVRNYIFHIQLNY